MNPNPAKTEWLQANQAVLVAEFARLKLRLEGQDAAGAAVAATEARAALEVPAAIDRVAELFELTEFEREVLLLCAGVEMDSRLATLCGEALGKSRNRPVTFGLAMAVLPGAHWSALTPARPLRRYQLVELEAGQGLTTAPVRISERVLHYLAGINLLEPQLQPVLRFSPVPDWMAESHQTVAREAVRWLELYPSPPPVVHLCGDDPEGQEDTAGLIAGTLGLQLLVVAAEDLPTAGPDLEKWLCLWEREARLWPAALLIQLGHDDLTPAARRLANRLPDLVFLASREPVGLSRPVRRFGVDKPEPIEQRALWAEALGPAAAHFNGTLNQVADQFRLSAKTIFATGSTLGRQGGELPPAALWQTCRSLARPRLENLACRIVPRARWDDLVLPVHLKQTLRQLVSQARQRMLVYETWGFAGQGGRGLGISALFAGDSGTGKTMAAEVLAGELGLDLYRIDLSSVVSKYIGETEMNIKQVFDAAEQGGVLLLFDEADALFGKRGEVKDSHDRYANIEVSYLLQRIETFQGLAILTTNLKTSIDRAFQRRLRFIVNFPFPDAEQRAAIWTRVFPAQTPVRGLEPKRLAQLNVAGGNIRNMALNAAFLAAEQGDGRPVEMTHLVQAAKLEAQKIERPLSEAEIRGWL